MFEFDYPCVWIKRKREGFLRVLCPAYWLILGVLREGTLPFLADSSTRLGAYSFSGWHWRKKLDRSLDCFDA